MADHTGTGGGPVDRADVYHATIRHFLRFLAPLMDREDVTEVMVVGWENVYYESKGVVRKSDLKFPDEQSLLAAVTNLAGFVGRPLGPANLTLDGRMPDGSRVHVILPPASRVGVCLTIRRFSKVNFTLESLVENGSLSPGAAEYLMLAVLLKKNTVVSGGTGTGKTSLLNAISGCIPRAERVIVVEDTSELRFDHEHTVRLEACPPDDNGEGGMSIRDLFVNSLRMRPDRVVVGEVRRGEALDMIQAMISGHPGSMTTVHANDPISALFRLELLCRLSEVPLPADVARSQVALAVQVVVQVDRDVQGVRRVSQVCEVVGTDSQQGYSLRRLYRLGPDADGTLTLKPTGATSGFSDEVVAFGIAGRVSASADVFQLV